MLAPLGHAMAMYCKDEVGVEQPRLYILQESA